MDQGVAIASVTKHKLSSCDAATFCGGDSCAASHRFRWRQVEQPSECVWSGPQPQFSCVVEETSMSVNTNNLRTRSVATSGMSEQANCEARAGRLARRRRCQLDVSSFFPSSSMSPIRLSKMNWANSSSSSSVILSTGFFGLKYFFLGFFLVMMSPWCWWRRDEHHWFCARSAASLLREAPWLGCSVADTSIEASLDAVVRLGEGCTDHGPHPRHR